ncbi:hypothetical protein C1H46_007896 [Malus baccata]|uniref:Uncharacterized protein n=1 Tax=Malus baccata TaxID=106549 RepID=A0A540N653_MALBA|nr:hypothetical protein C1H46_007896 [Malus baccata]
MRQGKDTLMIPYIRILRILKICCRPCLRHSCEAITASCSSNRSAKPRSQPCLKYDCEAIDPDDAIVSSTSAPLSTPPTINTLLGP